MFNAKHIATFLLGAAAGVAAAKYSSMTDEEKEKMVNDLKDKAHKFKDEAEMTAEKAKEYFEELKTKGGEAMKEHLSGAESFLSDLLKKKPAGPQQS